MSFISEIFAGGAAGVFEGVKSVVSSFKADPLELARLEHAMMQTEMQLSVSLSQAQTKVNEIEAASNDKFASRWRPAVGWICVSGLGYATLFHPLMSWVCFNAALVAPPQLDTTILMEIVTGLLGLAGLRTYEKVKK